MEDGDVPLLVPGEKISDGTGQPPEILGQQTAQQPENHNNTDEELPLELNATNDAESHQAIIEQTNIDLEGECNFRKILNHTWKNGSLIMKAQYVDTVTGTFEIDTPFKKLKVDEPLACAKYIRQHIVEQCRGDRPLNDWEDKTFKAHMQITRQIMRLNPG